MRVQTSLVALAAFSSAGLGVGGVLGSGHFGSSLLPSAFDHLSLSPASWTQRDRQLESFLAQVGVVYGEYRLTHPAAQKHVPYNPLLSARVDVTQPPLNLLARLEAAGDLRAIGTAYLMSGNRALGLRYFERAGHGPDALSDRGAAFLALADHAQALEVLDQALALEPEHPEAHWNRGLVLESLDLRWTAAEAFAASARSSTDPWAEIAAERAARNRRAMTTRRDRWVAADAAGKRMVLEAVPMPRNHVLDAPGIAQVYLYDALRSAQSSEEVMGLLPVAAALDGLHDGQDGLVRRVKQTATRNFEVRAPLGRRYRDLFQRALDDPQIDRLIDDARHAGEQDILLGAIYLGYREGVLVDEYVRLARATQEPWFETLAETVLAEQDRRSMRLDRSFTRLLQAAEMSPHPYRRTATRILAITRGTLLHRITKAQGLADAAWDEARQRGAWSQELQLLQQYGRLGIYTHQLALARAFFRETVLREPAFRESLDFVGHHWAMSELQNNDVDGARRALEWTGSSHEPADSESILTLVEVHRGLLTPERAAPWIQYLQKSIRQPISPGDATFSRAVQGRLLLELGRTREGISLLRQVMERNFQTPAPDAIGIHAHAIATAGLIMHYGALQQPAAVLNVAARSLGARPPQRCTLGIFVDAGRYTVAWHGAGGDRHGVHEPDFRTSLDAVEARDLVPDPARRDLDGCASVRVFASPNLVGESTLLPPSTAWSFVLGGRSEAGSELPLLPRTPQRLVVANVVPPPQLDLAPLPPYRGDSSSDLTTFVSDRKATVERVLEEMQHATEVEFYTHGTYNLGESHASMLVLSPDAEGGFALTADLVREARLEGAPLVLLTACSTTKAPRYRHGSWSLPQAFLDAGATTVVAAAAPVPSIEGQAFFDQVKKQIRNGIEPAIAVRDARMKWAESTDSTWMEHVLVFGR